MLRKQFSCVLLSLLALLVVASPAVADDLLPPVWRGAPFTTSQEWDFLTGDPTPDAPMDYLPDGMEVPYVNPYGGAVARYLPGTGQHWWEFLDGREGVLPLSGVIYLDIWNRPELDPEKLIRIQITWQEQVPEEVPVISIPEFEPGSEPFDWLIYDSVTTPLEGDWKHTVIDISIWPNPMFESIRIGGAIDVDQIVIDTICPEPSSLVLLGLGGVAMLRRRRR